MARSDAEQRLPSSIRQVPSRVIGARQPVHAVLWEPGWLQSRFDAHRSLSAVAGEAGCTVSAVRHAADRLGVTHRRVPRHPELHDRDWLCERYVVEQRSMTAIAGLLGASVTAVSEALRRAGIARRPPTAQPQPGTR